MTLAILVQALAFAATAFLTFVLMKIGLRKGVLDIPNERSSHTSPVPRGGGLSIVITFLVFLVTNLKFGFVLIDASTSWALIVGGSIIAAIGALDDLGHVDARWRVMVHLMAAAAALYLLHSLPEVSVMGLRIDSEYFVLAALSLALVWFVNLFNFMDGIDGIAGIEAISALSSGALILFIAGDYDWLFLFGVLGAAVAGFLVWNWAPAKVFMGDACSGFLGLTLGVLAVATSVNGAIDLWAWVIIFGVFVVDSTTTLIIRIFRGDTWYAAHRSHAYQILSRRYNSHAAITLAVLSINLLWLLPLAALASFQPFWSFPLCVIALSPLVILAIAAGAGRPDPVAPGA